MLVVVANTKVKVEEGFVEVFRLRHVVGKQSLCYLLTLQRLYKVIQLLLFLCFGLPLLQSEPRLRQEQAVLGFSHISLALVVSSLLVTLTHLVSLT